MKIPWIKTIVLAMLGAAICVAASAVIDDSISRAELEARARVAQQRVVELQAQIKQNQHAIEQNLHSINELENTVAEMKGRQAVWGTVLTLLSGSGIIVTMLGHKKKDPP